MKRFLLLVAALVFVASSQAEAGQRYYYRSNYRPARSYNYSYNYNRQPGPFAQLMELERAKNAWLRSVFMGY